MTTDDTRPLRLATRSSRQAVAQSSAVATAIEAATGRAVELVTTETLGDRRLDVPLHSIGGQGVFVKEVQEHVLRGDADIAVHSAKDLPSVSAPGLVIGAFTARRRAHDALVGASLAELAHGARLATGSVRRRAQLSVVRPDLEFAELRGNIDTRLSKVPAGGAIVMAVAALEILDLTHLVAELLDVARFVPAVGQGCVAVECRSDDAATRDVLAAIDDVASRAAVEIERAFLAELGAGCALPLGAHVTPPDALHPARLHTFLGPGSADDAPDAGRAVNECLDLDSDLTGPPTASDLAAARAAAQRSRAAIR